MASIQPRGSRWVVRYRDADGTQRRESFRTKTLARERRAEVEHTLTHGTHVGPEARRMTVAEWAEVWLATGEWRASTRKGYERVVRKHINPTFGDMRLAAVRPSHVRLWLRQLADDGAAPNSVVNYYNRLVSLMEAAVADRLIAVSPCKGVKAPTVPLKRVVCLEAAQVAAITAAMPARYAAAVSVAAGSGLRLSEVLGLTVDRLVLSDGAAYLMVDRQRLPDGGLFGPPKTEASNRTVPIGDALVAELITHMAVYAPATQWVEGIDGADGGSGHLFTGPEGAPAWHSDIYDAWNTATAKLGLPDDADTFHALRHYYASALIRAGVNLVVVKEMLGHSSITETVDTYGHLMPTDHDAVRRAMADI